MNNGQSAGKDLAYLYGVYFGEGSITKRSEKHFQFAFETIDLDFMNKVLSVLKKLVGKNPKVNSRQRSNGSPTYYISVSNIFFKEIFDITLSKKVIPNWILNGDRDIKASFIEGCMDSDGWVSQHTKKNGEKQFSMGYCKSGGFVVDIYEMMLDLGLQVLPPKAKQQKSKKICFYFAINMQSWLKSGLTFSIKRKNDRVKNYEEKFGNPQRLYA